MASKITRAPLGLLNVLGTKTLGQNPDAISELVRPSLSMIPFYWAEARIKGRFAEQVGSAVGAYAAVTVPQDEIWFVHAVSIRLVGGVALTNARFYPRVLVDLYEGSGRTNVELGSNYDFGVSIAVGGSHSVTWSPGYPLAFNSNSTFEAWCGTTLAGASTFRTEVLFSPFKT